MSVWLTRKQAAARVKRSERTIRRWEDSGLRSFRGLFRESEVVEMDKEMRSKVGRPKKSEETVMSPTGDPSYGDEQ